MYKSAFFCYFSPFLFTVDVITLQCTSLIKKSNIEDEIDCCIYHTLLLLAGFVTR